MAGYYIRTPEHREKMSEIFKGRKNTWIKKGRLVTWGAKISEGKTGKMTGENNPAWRGGISFEPYCHKFNDRLKEQIRHRDNRTCQLCGKAEILNGQRLSVHHINSNKMQGCDGKKWFLASLCRSCCSNPDTLEKEFLIVSNLSKGAKRK